MAEQKEGDHTGRSISFMLHLHEDTRVYFRKNEFSVHLCR